PLSRNLSSLSQLGLEALNYLQNKSKPDTEWINYADNILDQSSKSYGTVEIAVLNGIRNMINALRNS
ncbi:MAG: hypothetical protein ACM34J_08740, partial [Ignavibacteria bacterium]